MQNMASADWMTLPERIVEVAGILAAGITRMKQREIERLRRGRTFSGNGVDVFAGKSARSNNTLPKGPCNENVLSPSASLRINSVEGRGRREDR